MDDVSLKHKEQAAQAQDRDLDSLIFNDKKEGAEPSQQERKEQEQAEDAEPKSRSSSIGNVLPVDRLKNGASTATKCVAGAPASCTAPLG